MTELGGLYALKDKPLRSITESLITRYKTKTSTSTDVSRDEIKSQDKPNTPISEEPGKLKFAFGFAQSVVGSLLEKVGLTGYSDNDFTKKEAIDNLLLQKKTAISYTDWLQVCDELDELQGFNIWKSEKESRLYDYDIVENSLNELRAARLEKNIPRLLYLIRTTWTRNLGNIGNVNLYRHSHSGTKTLIEDYLDECNLALDEVTKENINRGLDDRYILGMLVQTRKNVGRTALVLSGGGCYGLFHIGVLAALLEENVLPRIISGSSAGAIVASILCVHDNDEIMELMETIVEQKFNIFEEQGSIKSTLLCLSRFLKYGTWYDNKNLQDTMIDFLGDLTFREAYNRTGRILNITVSPASVHEHPRLLNYLTAPSVLIWSAVCASCSLPGVFPSSTIYEKNSKTGATQEWHHASVKFVDGSVDNDLPIARLSEMFNVDHIIACQVNPHVVPFLKLSVTCVGGEIETEYSAIFKTKLGQIYGLWSAEVIHYLQMGAEVGVARNLCTKLTSVLSQQYSGDITILPDLREISKLNKLLANPTPEYLLHCTMKGARATWPKISIIKNHCGIEFALDNAIKLLRGRNFKNLNLNLALVNSPNFNSEKDNDPNLAKDSITLETQTYNRHTTPKPEKKTSSTLQRHHQRHRSESLSIERLRNLRSVKSHLHVDGENVVYSGRRMSESTGREVKSHRSYSATGKLIESSYNRTRQPSFSISSSANASQGSSPLNFQSGYDGYFRRVKTPVKKSFEGYNRPASSGEDRITGQNLKNFNNIDSYDGLFETSPTKKRLKEDVYGSSNYDDDDGYDDDDPIKVDDNFQP
ncbi:Patatin-like phospholipase domain-containing protein [Wickerhamomyces ciferrii]|uniref:Patatin-like phospholipase domain-containing protein n=1 Tax=Wickerhamomyces ciferrii (strain ATCC 14091 / BCRC 22168 / CBS 111 / JCM 3599 / NBRC 0793 / NRRL Y-1031 F-60-10) TaxID=1206466 RepID=K0KLB4_WICCF|nr:Patatin-like phospholipase domain-containing protein [Wickerhamomyces ciferrii]CCH42997.1 Patatin-like phospholipase domain-containing protein [Wickerhamomyces ciferrii]